MMRKKLKLFLGENFFVLAILLISLFVCYKNFTPGTWLTGWDTLHPEFDFSLNLKRLFFGVWREEQGLGAMAVHSHMADLPRVLGLSFLSLFLSTNFLRYFYFFFCLVFGPLGVYYFLERIIFKNNKKAKPPSFLGALFYLLNLGTLQHFYVPFEMFAAQYAFLPWLSLFSAKFLIEKDKKNLVWFSLLSLLATPMAYAASLWYVYFAGLIIFSLSSSFILNRSKELKKPIFLILITLLINSFWLLPHFYFLTTSARNVPQAKINQLFSENAFAHDAKYATIKNAAILKGFLFDWQEYSNGAFRSLLSEWIGYLGKDYVLGIGYLFSLIIILGFAFSLLKRKRLLPLLLVFTFTFAFLAYSSPPLSYLFSFIRNQFSILKEAMRFPWTKFSILMMFTYSCFFSFGIHVINKNFSKKRKVINQSLLLFLTLLLILWMMPIFSGHLISPSRRTELLDQYFELHSWSKKQNPNERMAQFPIPTFWGWEYYRWGFEGAGFVWFGLDQSLLVRDFDRWSPDNENYYWEISYALYSDNLSLFEKVLEKYQINWFLIDGNVINPSSPRALYFDELGELIAQSEKISLVQEFGKIKIYQVGLETPIKDFVFLAQNLPQIGPVYRWNNYDQAYLENGIYLSSHQSPTTDHQFYYPFRSLFTGRSQEDLEFEIEEEEDYFTIKNSVPKEFQNYQLLVSEEENKELIHADPEDLSQVEFLQPELEFNGKAIKVKIPRVAGLYSTEIQPTKIKDFGEAVNCQEYLGGQVENEIIQDNNNQVLRLKAIDAKNCGTSFWLPNLTHQLSYLITVEAQNIKGKSLLFWLENLNSRKADLETSLPKTKAWQKYVFIQPPMEEDGLGYSLHFDNLSIGREESINDLGKITINPFPFEFLTSLKLVNPETQAMIPKLYEPGEVSHPNPSQYTIESNFEANQILVLSQAYHGGWLAWEGKPFLGKKLEHVLVNNWENGWVIKNPQTETIHLFFWPQLLEYFGFFLLLVTLTGVGVCCLKRK